MKKISKKIEINFKKKTLSVLLYVPISTEIIEDTGGIKHKRFYLEDYKNWQEVLNKSFKISKDYSCVSIENTSYLIPNSYDKNLIRNKDLKTFEAIFNQILNPLILDEIKKYKTLITILEQKRNDDLSGKGIDNKVVVANF